MAIMRPGALAGQLSGRVGGVVFSRNRGGDYVRSGPSPTNPKTSYQIAVRNALSLASTRWNDMAVAARAAWKVWAGNNPVQNRIGETIRLQGNAAFVELNARLAYLGTAVVDTPPIISAPAPLLTLVGTFDIGAGAFGVTFTADPLPAGIKLWVLGCWTQSAGVSNVNNKLRHFYTSVAAATGALDLQPTFEARFGAPGVGASVWFRAGTFDGTNGQLAAMLEVRGTVVST